MTFSPAHHFSISVEKQWPGRTAKAVFPLRFGKYSEIKTSEYEFLFNLNGEIKFIRGLNVNWPHPAEQLKRTDGGDWVYYTVGDQGGDKGVISWLGEYYLPCLPYPSNSIWEINYFSNPAIMNAFGAWAQLFGDLYYGKDRLHPRAKSLAELILRHDDRILHERSKTLRDISVGMVSVLPPDTRHVDYEVIPLIIADGCLYHCKFCCVKSNQKFQVRSNAAIIEQIDRLKAFYGGNIENYNALFLGNHDALGSGFETIRFAASEAADRLGLSNRGAQANSLFLFGSVGSLLDSPHELFRMLNGLPFQTYINVGFESVDAETLALIHKPLDVSDIRRAFNKMRDINNEYANIEITGNFLIGDQLSAEHYESLMELLSSASPASKNKGGVYLSPLKDSPKKRELLPRFYEIKRRSRLPVYIYLIQRL